MVSWHYFKQVNHAAHYPTIPTRPKHGFAIILFFTKVAAISKKQVLIFAVQIITGFPPKFTSFVQVFWVAGSF